MAKVSNEIKDLYRKVRSKLLSQVRRLEKMGFTGAREKVPKIPKTIKPESISNLERLTKNKYAKLKEGLSTEEGKSVRDVEYERRKKGIEKAKKSRESYYDEDTGEVMTKSQYARNVVDNYRSELGAYNDAFSSYMDNYIEELVRRYGYWDVSRMINEMADAGVLPSRWQQYTSEGALHFTNQVFSFLPELHSVDEILAMSAYANSLMELSAQSFDDLRSDYNNERRMARQAQRR